MKTKRSTGYRSKWGDLIEAHGPMCFYCETWPANSIDHIIPAAYGGGDNIENLVLSCITCNLLAGSQVFDDVYAKAQYINNRRKNTLRHAICTDCTLPFEYRVTSPSLFLCAECYDYHYDTSYAQARGWHSWLIELADAGYILDVHRSVREEIRSLDGGRLKNKQAGEIMLRHMIELGYI